MVYQRLSTLAQGVWSMNIGESFWDELTGLIEKYSGVEMTNAECVGYLMFKINDLMTPEATDEKESD
jgi:hypothetical protein